MKLVSLLVKNFYGMDSFLYEYRPGVSGLLGHVGSNKSSFGEYAQYFAVTGSVPTTVDKKEHLISWGKSSGGTELVFDHDGIRYTLFRALQSAKVRLTWTEEGTTKKLEQKEAGDLVTRMLGMTPEVFYECCFVRQGGLWDILLMTHAERMKYFQKITGTIKAERLRDMLSKVAAKLPTYPDRTEEIAQCTAVITANDKTSDTLKAAIEQLEKRLKDEFDMSLEEIIAKLGSAVSEDVWRQNTANAVASKRAAEEEVKRVNERVKTECGDSPPTPEELPSGSAEFHREYESYCTKKADAERAGIQYDQRKKELDDLKTRAAASAEAVEESLKRLTEATEAFAAATTAVKDVQLELSLARKGVCPTCKTKIKADPGKLTKSLEEAKAAQEKANADIAERQAAHSPVYLSDKDLQKEVADLSYTVGLLERNKQLPDGARFSKYDPAAYLAKLAARDEYNAWHAKRNQFQPVLAKADRELSQATVDLENAKKAPYMTAAEIAELTGAKTRQASIRNAIQEHRQNAAEAAAVSKSQRTLKESYEADMAKQAAIVEYRKDLEVARKYLHRDVLPKIVMGHLRASLAYEVHSLLRTFDMPFTVELTSEFDYVVHWGAQRDLPISCLSGGQKIIVAICHHLSLANILAGSVPVMFIDEPTNHMGEAEKAQVRECLFALKQKAGKSTPILVATHEPALHAAFARSTTFTRKEVD